MTEKIKRQYYENGNIQFEKYYLNGGLHNDNGPAFIIYYPNGLRKCEHYYLNGKLHRDNGPADIEYYYNGNISRKYYYLDNKNVTKIYNEINEILKQLYIQYPNKDDLALVFKLSYYDLYYQVFRLIERENGPAIM